MLPMLLKYWRRLSITVSITSIICTLCLISIISMTASIYLSSSIQGNTQVINKIGSIRMKVYALLSRTQSDAERHGTIADIELILKDGSFIKIVNKNDLDNEYLNLNIMWSDNLKGILTSIKQGNTVTPSITENSKKFIIQLEYIIKSIERVTEHNIFVINSMQKLFTVVVIFFSFIAIYSLNKRFFKPWAELLNISKSIQLGDFGSKFDTQMHDYRDEMWELGHAFNNMSEAIKHTYDNLERMVADKTVKLNQQNLHLGFLYRCCQLFQNQEFNCQVLAPFMKELIGYTGANKIKLFIYDPHKLESKYCNNFYTFGDSVKPSYCSSENCKLCVNSDNFSGRLEENFQVITCDINDTSNKHGYIEFFFLKNEIIHHEAEQLVLAFCSLLSQSLSLYYKEQQQQQLLLLKERNSIAQTLHDSIAQSLSYLKIKISILQRDSNLFSSVQNENIVEMRAELNEAYSNIRKLISTFRMPYKSIELFIMLKDVISSFNDAYGFNINLEYKSISNEYSKEQKLYIFNFLNDFLEFIKCNILPSRIEFHIQTLNDNVILVVKGGDAFQTSYELIIDYLLLKEISFSSELAQIEINLHLN